MKRGMLASAVLAITLLACAKPSPLTPQKADEIVRGATFAREPVYAEVPQRVWFGPKSPQDDFDRKSIVTLHNLEHAGLVTVAESHDGEGMTTIQAKVTQAGFKILGTMPSARGPVYRGRICEKQFDRVQNLIHHPSDPKIGRAEIVWHYTNPTPLYAMFETKINKPLDHPFVSVASFYWRNGAWRFGITVKKTDPENAS